MRLSLGSQRSRRLDTREVTWLSRLGRIDQLLFLADAVLHPLHVERPEITAVVDHQPDTMVTTRRGLLDKAADHNAIVMASHFPFPGVGRISRHDAGWQWNAI